MFVSAYLFTILWTSVFPSFFGCSGLTGGEALSHSWVDNVLSGDRSVNNGSSSRSLWDYIRQKHNDSQNVMKGIISGSKGLFSIFLLWTTRMFSRPLAYTSFYLINIQISQPSQILNEVWRKIITSWSEQQNRHFWLVQNHCIKSLKLFSHIFYMRVSYTAGNH